LINTLNAATIEHPRPYTLPWLKNGNEEIVSKQASVTFSFGEYKDELVCDVLAMDTFHLPLGRPWQYDRNVLHYDQSNTYSFKLNGKRMTLTPLGPNQTHKPETGRGKLKESSLLGNKRRVEKDISKGKPIYALLMMESTPIIDSTPPSSSPASTLRV